MISSKSLLIVRTIWALSAPIPSLSARDLRPGKDSRDDGWPAGQEVATLMPEVADLLPLDLLGAALRPGRFRIPSWGPHGTIFALEPT